MGIAHATPISTETAVTVNRENQTDNYPSNDSIDHMQWVDREKERIHGKSGTNRLDPFLNKRGTAWYFAYSRERGGLKFDGKRTNIGSPIRRFGVYPVSPTTVLSPST